jgi:CDP-diglyceride synthetase
MKVVNDAREQVANTVARVRRTSPGPALIRCIATFAAATALVTALPWDRMAGAGASQYVRVGIAVMCVSALVGLWPRTRIVSLVALGVVGLWLFSTLAFSEPIGLVRLGLLSASLYLTHAAAAFAAVLPYDCVLARGVLVRWLVRVGRVLAVSLALGLGTMAATDQLSPVRTQVGAIIGALTAAGLVGLLVWLLLRQRSDADDSDQRDVAPSVRRKEAAPRSNVGL